MQWNKDKEYYSILKDAFRLRMAFHKGATHALTSQLPSLCGWTKSGIIAFFENIHKAELSQKEKEIETMRVDYKAACFFWDEAQKQIESLQEENKRLRKALEDLLKQIPLAEHNGIDTSDARAALEPGK